MSYDRFNNSRTAEVKTPTSIWLRILDIVMFFVAVAACVALLVALMAQYISPEHGWILPVMGLLAPLIYILGVVTALYWIIRWKWHLALPVIIVLAIGANRVTLITQMPFTKDYDTESYRGTIKVITYNVRGLRDDNYAKAQDQFEEFFISEKPDIVCVQEGGENKVLDLGKGYYNHIISTLGIYSRYPIINSGICFDHKEWKSGNSIYADVVIKEDTVRIFNNHLHTTEIKKADDDYLTSTMVVRDSMRTDRVSDIISRLQSNAVERAEQARLVRAQIEKTPYEVIVCGDFNETPISYTYHKIAEDLTDSFQVCGDDYSYTYRGFYNLLRIDYVLVSSRITPRSYMVDETMEISDHLPVIVRVQIEKQQ